MPVYRVTTQRVFVVEADNDGAAIDEINAELHWDNESIVSCVEVEIE
jgi:hypothetical protein